MQASHVGNVLLYDCKNIYGYQYATAGQTVSYCVLMCFDLYIAQRTTGIAKGGIWGPRPSKGSGKNVHNRFSCAKETNIYVKVLCLVIVNVNVTKYTPQKCQIAQICGYQVCFFQTLNSPKLVFRPGLCPGPRLGDYDAPPDPLVG